MAVIISAVEKNSPADKASVLAGETLISINSNEIMDVLDYRFYQNNKKTELSIIDKEGNQKIKVINKAEYEELGLLFDSYLMDKKHCCKNKCIFCFIDQLPKGLRDSLYFKDDDSRLSFLFGNYITLTNLTEHEIERIIKMHISPINISVHTTNPELRTLMMNNKNAGEVLKIIPRLNDAGIKINCQLVLCPDYNDGDELKKSLADLSELQNVLCIAAVPVGLTKYRQGLTPIKPFDKSSAQEVLDIIKQAGDSCLERYGERRIYAADEFYLLAEKQIPNADYYGEFLQLENGVGLISLLREEAKDALKDIKPPKFKRHISIATGKAADPFIKEIADKCCEKAGKLSCEVYGITNDFLGERITVTGLLTATDIYNQLKDKTLGSQLLISSSMLNSSGDMFLDSVTLRELSEKLKVKITVVDNNGYSLISAIMGKQKKR